MLEKRYTIIPDSPRPMESGHYADYLKDAWAKLLDGNPTERDVQHFLEQHPALIPGAFSVIGGLSGHAPFPDAVISQPELYGYQRRKPNFMWISKNSLTLNPVLIEIEAPEKKMFRKDGTPTAEFTQAKNQLLEWKVWFSKPENQMAFLRDYAIPFHRLRLEPQYVLIFGRRSEYEGNEQLTRLRSEQMGANEVLMSFDRLGFDANSDQFLSVRHKPLGYEVLHVPPTLWLGPAMFSYEVPLDGLSAAVDNNPFISGERKGFIKDRLPYWVEINRARQGIYSQADRE
ncbi:Shedu immune nuclease family protein [Croceibacterium ferulae]|uniref:Shedu immune nuclease family protein n=1 Tax=Croceibacterium ferulae TaxID=1854641 RepID=UPI000EB3C377|nr:Shedu immune nuclease family protein [Croceibacterium ferulae]